MSLVYELLFLSPFFPAMLFSGRTNSIQIRREYYQEYACEFDLVYYPFDTQVGNLNVLTPNEKAI